jgi:murein DD-endopeptidase MepM/ murein hydrolase activator NlpD
VTRRGWLVFVLVVLLGAAGAGAWLRAEGTSPEIRAPDAIRIGAGPSALALELFDAGSGLREVRVLLKHARGEAALVEERYPGSWIRGGSPGQVTRVEVPVDPALLHLKSGDAFLHVFVRDWSWRDGFRGNQSVREVPLAVDLDAPRIRVVSGLTYVSRGGAGSVTYTVSEPTSRDGVRVGDVSFRGFESGGGLTRFALFAVPTDAPPDPSIRVFAVDEVGNESEASWPAVFKERALPEAQVTLQPRFLNTKVRGLARSENLSIEDPAEAFREINTTLRRANEMRIREALATSAAEPLWHGPFEQLSNSKVTSRFGEHRRYHIGGKPVSEATHLGYDLASTAAAKVTAANSGRVAFSGELGIYGNCVLVDHGLGLASLYGHLSRIDVAQGDRVEKSGVLGLSGATGLAGGDHLHFAILVGGTYVDPLEWWDADWVRTHIEARLLRSTP